MYSCYVGGGKCSSPRPTNENHHHHHHKREPKSSKKKKNQHKRCDGALRRNSHSPYARRRPNENNNGFWFLGEVWSFYPSFSGRTTYRLLTIQYLGVSVEVGTVGTYCTYTTTAAKLMVSEEHHLLFVATDGMVLSSYLVASPKLS